MAVKRRVIWLSDEEWEKVGERAEAFGLSRSAYIGKLIAWRQPGQVGEALVELPAAAERVFAEFRPVPKPSKRK